MIEHTQVTMVDTDTPEEGTINLLDLLQVLAENWRLLVIGPLLAGVLALGISFFIPPTFTATNKFLPPQQQQSSASAMLQSLGSLGGLAGAASGLKNPADQYVAFVKSRSVQDALVDRFKLMERYDKEFREDARKALETNVVVSSAKDGLITILVDDKDPQFAAQLANAHVEELGKLLNRLAVTEAQQRRVFFEKQLNTAKDNLVKAELALKSSGVNSGVLKSDPKVAVESIARLKASIVVQEIKLATMRGYLTENAPDFKLAQTELAALRSQITRAEKEEPATDSNNDYVTKYRDFKYNETLFELFAKQYEIARVDESREGSIIQVVDTALPPERKSKPKKATIAISVTLATGILLLLIIFICQALRSAKANVETARKLKAIRDAMRSRKNK
ncbi:Wzz/FepE/Etk N-terminal domain-containing protein [soil metagenome]